MWTWEELPWMCSCPVASHLLLYLTNSLSPTREGLKTFQHRVFIKAASWWRQQSPFYDCPVSTWWGCWKRTYSRREACLGKRHSGMPKKSSVLLINALAFSISGSGFGLAPCIIGRIAHFCLRAHSSIGQMQPRAEKEDRRHLRSKKRN